MTYVLNHTRYANGNAILMTLCTDNEFHDDKYCRPNCTRQARTWKTEAGAMRYAAERWNSNGQNYCVVGTR